MWAERLVWDKAKKEKKKKCLYRGEAGSCLETPCGWPGAVLGGVKQSQQAREGR